MHHLKTMVESFIYFHVLLRDDTDATANRILAEICYRRNQFYARNPEYADPDDLVFWLTKLGTLETQGVTRIGKTSLETLAQQHSSSLRKWYDAVYTAACEPAHITDLLDFMPSSEIPALDLGAHAYAHIDARVALDRGLAILLGMLRSISSENTLGITLESLPSYEVRHAAIQAMKWDHPAPPSGE